MSPRSPALHPEFSKPCEALASASATRREALYQALVQAGGGPVLGGEPLRRALGFRTDIAFTRACERAHVGVHTFRLPFRRGRFAFAEDVADWLIACAHGGATEPKDRPDEED